ncbi:c-type cytochrome [Paenibacillus sp. IB182496]|uniref:C-type cytochrome n=1 Tax=Paenibacillus sabuli TaxID=2772509 RepID=A0A927BT08_9BACL|nr:menaquinol-cytochrome c reductase cytochrome b/c subunit [Paenibacillus sabuli]MBD2845140.1 c-type cytochrome [Paenibacillus sabuli]
MALGHHNDEKIVYVGDSRVPKRNLENVPPDYSAFPGRSEAFIPNFLLKEWMVGCVALVGFLVLTIAHPAPLGYQADPTNAAFIPMPDWYFLFMYQLLKYPYVSGDYVVLGTLGIPGVAFTALLIAPFLDTGKERRFYRRPIASALMLLSIIACIYLTKISWDHYQHQLELTGTTPEHILREEKAREAAEKAAQAGQNGGSAPVDPADLPLVQADDPAMSLMEGAGCLQCHAADLKGQGSVPALRGTGDLHSKEELVDIITNGQNGMPAFEGNLSTEEIDQIATWLALQKAPTE